MNLARTNLRLFTESDVNIRRLEREHAASPDSHRAQDKLAKAYARAGRKEDTLGLRWSSTLHKMGRSFKTGHEHQTRLNSPPAGMTRNDHNVASFARRSAFKSFHALGNDIRGAARAVIPDAHPDAVLGRVLKPHHVGGDENHRHALMALHGFRPKPHNDFFHNYARERREGGPSIHTNVRITTNPDPDLERLRASLKRHGHLKTHDLHVHKRRVIWNGIPTQENSVGLTPKKAKS